VKDANTRSTLNLLIDLVYEAKCAELRGITAAPSDGANEIMGVLERRSGQIFLGEAEKCLAWYLSSDLLDVGKKERLRRMIELGSGQREFLDVFCEMIKELKKSD
jgi:hypothetical protein